MGSNIKSLILILFMFQWLMRSVAAEHDTDVFLYSCDEPFSDNKTKDDTYEANIRTLLSDLISNSTTQANGFFTSVVGWGTPYSISGRILCRGDVTPSTCQRCVTLAAEKLLSVCPNVTQSTINYDLCMLQYTSKSFQFDSLLPDGSFWSNNKIEITDESHFNQTLWLLFRNVTAKAACSTSTDKKFAIDEVPVTATHKLYGLAQCMPDLTVSQCSKCFQTALRQLLDCGEYFRKRGECCCAESPRASVFVAGCNVRYDTHRFYDVSFKASNIPDIHPTPPGKQRRTESPNIVLIVAPIIVSATLFCLSCYLLRRKQRKSEQAILTENCNISLYTCKHKIIFRFWHAYNVLTSLLLV